MPFGRFCFFVWNGPTIRLPIELQTDIYDKKNSSKNDVVENDEWLEHQFMYSVQFGSFSLDQCAWGK